MAHPNNQEVFQNSVCVSGVGNPGNGETHTNTNKQLEVATSSHAGSQAAFEIDHENQHFGSHHAVCRQSEEARADRGHSESGRRATRDLGGGRAEMPPERVGGDERHHSPERKSPNTHAAVGCEVEYRHQEEERLAGICSRAWSHQHRKLHSGPAAEGLLGAHLHASCGRPHRCGWLRGECTHDVRGAADNQPDLLPVGPEDGSRGQYLLPPEPSGYLAGQQPQEGGQQGEPEEGPRAKGQVSGTEVTLTCQQQQCTHRSHTRDPGHDDDLGRNGEGPEGRGGGAQGGTPPQEEGDLHGQRVQSDVRQELGEDSLSIPAQPLDQACSLENQPAHNNGTASESMCRFFQQETQNLAPGAFQSLMSHDRRTYLVEVACSPDSRLSREVQRQAGYEEAAIRCSHWNGCDLGTGSGVQLVLQTITEKRPSHVWISPECGPYSPMQTVNQRTESQIADLTEKRRVALKQYIGASCIYQFCIQEGIHVTWEWSQRCQGWRLPFMQKLIRRYNPFFATTQGCQVNLRDTRDSRLMHKGWKVMTTHQHLADMLNLPCRCPKGFSHARCEGGAAGLSAYYTPEYVKRVWSALSRELPLPLLRRELSGQSCLLSCFGEGASCYCGDLRCHGSTQSCGTCLMSATVGPQAKPGNHEKTQEGRKGSSGSVGEPSSATRQLRSEAEHHDAERRKATRSDTPHVHATHTVMHVEQAYPAQQFHDQLSDEDIKRKLYLLHAATGHSSVSNMLTALKRRKVNKRVLDLAAVFQCPLCQEKRKINTKHASSLEPLPPKFNTISADGAKWTHPFTKDEYEFAVIIDEGSRYRTARILKTGHKQTMSANLFLQYMTEGWIQYFGRPSVLRLDPVGAFRSKEIETFCDQHGIFLDVIPGEAHWHLGTCEQAVKGLKEVLTKLVEQEEDVPVELALAEAVRTFNSREIVRGYSPIQHVLGKSPDETGRFVSSLTGQNQEVLLGNPQGEPMEDIERMKKAEQALSEWQAQQKITKAMNSRSQPKMDYRPGDLVYFWRKQISGQPAGKNGRFLGPARILATETKREADGSLRKGSAVWCVRGRRLLKCCPEQLRPASVREEMLEELEQAEPEAPWTFPRVASELGGNEYVDISNETPTLEAWHKAQDPMEVEPPTRRHRRKRPVSEPRNVGQDARQRKSRPTDPNHQLLAEAKPWWDEVGEEAFYNSTGDHMWAQERAMVEVAIDMPDTRRGMQKAIVDLEGYFVNNLKRRSIEVSEKRLTADEYRQFQEAKQKEVKNFLAARAFEALPPEMKPSREQAIGMRWILTWKKQEDGTKKAKARAILKGFQDPNYETRSTTTPVMTRQTRQLLLQMAAWKKWKVKKGDVSGAFLQGRGYPNELYCIPCPEILEAMGLQPNEILRVKRGCYGLVDAPLEWYRTISDFLGSLGLTKSWADPCAWLWKPDGVTRGMIAGHVDDFLFAGDKNDPAWQLLETIGRIGRKDVLYSVESWLKNNQTAHITSLSLTTWTKSVRST